MTKPMHIPPGQKFGRYTVLYEGERQVMPSFPTGARTFWCQCECGTVKRVRIDHLASGRVKSCGCWSRDAGLARGVPTKVGERFGRGVVIDARVRITYPSFPNGCPSARLMCDCGNEYEATNAALRRGLVKSCGCLQRDGTSMAAARAAVTTHGLSKHPLYCLWTNMVRRCTDERDKAYVSYGGRGIKVCEEWLGYPDGPRSYITWIEANLGPRPEGRYPSGVPRWTIDRIDNESHYEPGNLRWATKSEQQRNRRNSRLPRAA